MKIKVIISSSAVIKLEVVCWCRFLFMIEHVMPLCLTISWVYTVAMLVQSVVYEKEQRLKEVHCLLLILQCALFDFSSSAIKTHYWSTRQ